MKPCPFCGGKAVLTWDNFYRGLIMCTVCKAEGPKVTRRQKDWDEELFIKKIEEAWNNRVTV